MTTSRVVLATLVAIVALVLTGCGKDMCVMAMGNCTQRFMHTQSPDTPTDALKLTASAQTVPINQKMYFTATGGTSPYTWAIVSGMGQIDTNGVFTAPNVPITTTVRVIDNAKAEKMLSVVVTLSR